MHLLVYHLKVALAVQIIANLGQILPRRRQLHFQENVDFDEAANDRSSPVTGNLHRTADDV